MNQQGRGGHVAAAVEDKVYVWGGWSGYKVSHDGPDKTDISFKVDILDVKVRINQVGPARLTETTCTVRLDYSMIGSAFNTQ